MLSLAIFATLLIILSLHILFSDNIINIVLSVAVFSIIICICYLLLDAPDVAMTEAAIGACITTVVMFNLLRSLNIDFLTIIPKKTKQIYVPDFAKYRTKYIASFIFCALIFALLIFAGMDMHDFGIADTPLHQHVSQYYLDNVVRDIGIPSQVAAILASYRGYDTMGETIVIFIASSSVILLLNSEDSTLKVDSRYNSYNYELTDYSIIAYLVKVILPFILVYGVYIQLNGEVSPGGGFQAGAIIASAIIAYSFFTLPQKVLRYAFIISVIGVLLYVCTGVLTTMLGGEFLNYYMLSQNPHLSQSIGIIAIEAGVGMTVFAAMTLIYFSFSLE